MNDLDRASTRTPPSATIASSLAAIVDRFGPAALSKPEDVRLLLRQDGPDADREIDLLLAALGDGIPQRMAAAHGSDALRDLLVQSVERLTRIPSFDATTATWAVRTWATALALPATGIDAPRAEARPDPSLVASFASVVTPLAGPRGQPTAKPVERAPIQPPSAATPAAVRSDAPPIVPAPVLSRVSAPVVARLPEPPSAAPRVVPEAVPVRRPASRSFPLKTAIAAGVATIVVALAWFGWRRMSDEPVRSSPVATTAIALPQSPSPPPSPVAAAAPDTAPTLPAPSTAATALQAGPEPAKAAIEAVETTVEKPAMAIAAPPSAPEPGEEAPPTIARVDVPRIATGKPFQVVVSVAGHADRVASVERRTGSGAAGGMAPFVANAVTTLSHTPSGGLVVPFRAIDAAGPIAVEFTLVDRSGVRGPSRRVELDVVASASTTPTAPASAPSPSSVGLAPCTRATCGSVASVRSLDAPGEVELIVRMDDRSIQTIRQTGRWRLGSRVQRIGERFVPIAAD